MPYRFALAVFLAVRASAGMMQLSMTRPPLPDDDAAIYARPGVMLDGFKRPTLQLAIGWI